MRASLLYASLLALVVTVEPRVAHAAEPSAWTVMFYWNADCDLEQDMMPILKGFESHPPKWPAGNARMNIVVLVDRLANPCSAPGSWCFDNESAGHGGLYLRQAAGGSLVRYVASESEVEMGKSLTLSDFMIGAAGAFPADNYALIFKDHGSGWFGCCIDETSGYDSLRTPELRQALKRFSKVQTEAGKKSKLDVIAFDTCLMGELEVAVSVAPYANWLVASADLTATDTWAYGKILDDMPNPTHLSPKSFAEFLVWKFGNPTGTTCKRDLIWPETSIASVFNLSKADAAWSALNSLADKLSAPATALPRQDVLVARSSGFPYGCDGDPGLCASEYLDLAGFAAALAQKPPGAVRTAAEAVLTSLGDLVGCTSSGPIWNDVGGISVYFPCDQVDQTFPQYKALDVTAGSSWLAFITAFRAGGCADTPAPGANAPVASIPVIGPGGVTRVTGNVRAVGGGSVRRVLFSVLADAPGAPSLGGLPIRWHRVPGGESPLALPWDGGWIHLKTGGPAIPCCIRHLVSPASPDSTVLADVPILRTAANSSHPEFLTLRLVLHQSQGAELPSSGEFLWAVRSSGAAPILVRINPEDQIQALWPRTQGSGAEWTASAPITVTPAHPLKATYERLAPGFWRVGHILEGYGGVRYPADGFLVLWPRVELTH